MKTRSTLVLFAPVTVKWTTGHVSKQQLWDSTFLILKPAASVCAGHAF